MNYHKLGGRHVLLSDSKLARPALDWLTDQPECTKVSVAGSRNSGGAYDGKPGTVRVVRAEGTNVWLRFYGERWMTDARAECPNEDAVARLTVKLCQRYGYPPPGAAQAPIPFSIDHGGRHSPHPAERPASAVVPRLVASVANAYAPPDYVAMAAELTHGVQTSTRVITPDVAADWLSRVKTQRRVNKHVVERYARDMAEGRWGTSESAIAFDKNGDLINGQHRLWAVFESGVTITSVVATGYEPSAIVHFDDGFARDASATFKMLNPTTDADKIDLAVAGRLVHALWKGGVNRKTPRQELFRAMELWGEGIRFAKNIVGKGTGGGVRVSSVLAAVTRAYYTPGVDHDRLREFGRVLTTGMANGEHDAVVIMLRNWLQTTGKNNIGAQDEAYGKTERALQAYLRGEVFKRNLIAASRELFPLPGEREGDLTATGRARSAEATHEGGQA